MQRGRSGLARVALCHGADAHRSIMPPAINRRVHVAIDRVLFAGGAAGSSLHGLLNAVLDLRQLQRRIHSLDL